MAKTASNNGRKNTSQSRKTNTQGKKTTAQGRKKQTKKNVQTQADQLKNDCIILFSIACAIIMVLSNFILQEHWDEELNGLCLAYLELWNTYFL